MCQYDLGYNLYCSNDECDNVHFVTQVQFLETFDEYRRLFAKHKRPCDCRERWFQWHYYATQSGRYKNPFINLCSECNHNRRAAVAEGELTENRKAWIKWRYPRMRREPYPRNGKPPKSLRKGFIQEVDIDTGVPKVKGRVINRFAYNSDDGTSVAGNSTPRGNAQVAPPPEAASQPMRYLEHAERPTEPVTTIQYDGYRPDNDNASDICNEDPGEESDTEKGKKREWSGRPPKGYEHFHFIEDKEWQNTRAGLLRFYAAYSASVDRADAKLQDAADRAQKSIAESKHHHEDASGSESGNDDDCAESSAASRSVATAGTRSSVSSKKRVRIRVDTDDESESESEASSAMAGLQVRGRR